MVETADLLHGSLHRSSRKGIVRHDGPFHEDSSKPSAVSPHLVSRCMMKIASQAKTRIMRLFLDVIEKISERSADPALSLERETYVRQEAKVLSLDGTESEELVPDRSL